MPKRRLESESETEMQEEPCISNMHFISAKLVELAEQAQRTKQYKQARLAYVMAMNATVIAHNETLKLGALLDAQDRNRQSGVGRMRKRGSNLDPFALDEEQGG